MSSYWIDNLELGQLIFAVLNGTADDDQHIKLEEWLNKDPRALEYYEQLVIAYASLHLSANVNTLRPSDNIPADIHTSDAFWQLLAEAEKTAQSIEVTKPAEEKPLIVIDKQKKVINRQRQVSRLSLFTAIISTAALIFIMLYVRTFPKIPIPKMIAVLTSTSYAMWDSAEDQEIIDGYEFFAGPQKLTQGFAELTFTGGTRVTLQAPAEIEFETPDQLFLKSGKLTAIVPTTSKDGFIVRTAKATVVDYGTEFGVVAHVNGETEAHVFDGMVGLRTGSDPVRIGESKMLTEGEAAMVDQNGRLSKQIMKANQTLFVKKVPKGRYNGLPGSILDLSDLVGGGNGFGTGKKNQIIDPVSGKITAMLSNITNRPGKNEYITLPNMPFIDGIFVPDGENGPVKISSEGNLFRDCPDTINYYWTGLSNDGRMAYGDGKTILDLTLNGVTCGTNRSPCINMHSNMGLTFDLDAIRSAIPGTNILSFRTSYGLGDQVDPDVRIDVWILLDGKVAFEHLGVKRHIYNQPINIKLSDEHRFLTLVTTDHDGQIGGNWFVFVNPILTLKSK